MPTENGLSSEEECQRLKEFIVTLDNNKKFQTKKANETLTRISMLLLDIEKLLDQYEAGKS